MKSIIFSGEMVRAILDGTKTQTRRVVNFTESGYIKEPRSHRRWHRDDPDAVLACPYGKVGDELYVRETFAEYPQEGCYIYKASEGEDLLKLGTDLTGCWTPSIHMPQKASRITLRIIDVRVQRLQDISEADAKAEGVGIAKVGQMKSIPERWVVNGMFPALGSNSHRAGFAILWDEINGKKHTFQSNPFVWAITFEVVK